MGRLVPHHADLRANLGHEDVGDLAQWTCNGERVASINQRAEHDRLHLTYRVRVNGGEWEDVTETVGIVRAQCRYGGARPYFICPKAAHGLPICSTRHSARRRRAWRFAWTSRQAATGCSGETIGPDKMTNSIIAGNQIIDSITHRIPTLARRRGAGHLSTRNKGLPVMARNRKRVRLEDGRKLDFTVGKHVASANKARTFLDCLRRSWQGSTQWT
jgi:hypothetical protein